MALYRVVRGFHYVGNKVLKAGDTFEVPCEDYECGTVFEKVVHVEGATPTEASDKVEGATPTEASDKPGATRRKKKKR